MQQQLTPGLYGHGDDAAIPDDTALDEGAWQALPEALEADLVRWWEELVVEARKESHDHV